MTVNWHKVLFSKTLWTNALFMIALLLQNATEFIFAPEEQAAVLVIVNLILRAVTNEGLIVKE